MVDDAEQRHGAEAIMRPPMPDPDAVDPDQMNI
jgi:hypothetical protein